MTQSTWNYNTKKKLRLSPLNIILIGIGVLTILYANETIGIIVLAIAFIIQTSYSGIEIDGEQKRIKKYNYIFLFKFGSWEDLKDVEYLAVVRVILGKKTFQASQARIAQVPSKNYTYRLNLISSKPKIQMRLFATPDRYFALNSAIEIGKLINVNVLDQTTPNRRWIYEKNVN